MRVQVADCWRYCNCQAVRIVRGQAIRVCSHSWDCPSHGRDKRLKIRRMVHEAQAYWMFTTTYAQPEARHPVDGMPMRPEEFKKCDRWSHVYTYKDGTERWRPLSACKHCCKRDSKRKKIFFKRLRRKYGDQVGYLWVREDQKNGAVHGHIALSGLPESLTDDEKDEISRWWTELGGGFSDLAPPDPKKPREAMGWYLGKYLAKHDGLRMAPGYRRWGRSKNFAPGVVMRERWRANEYAAERAEREACDRQDALVYARKLEQAYVQDLAEQCLKNPSLDLGSMPLTENERERVRRAITELELDAQAEDLLAQAFAGLERMQKDEQQVTVPGSTRRSWFIGWVHPVLRSVLTQTRVLLGDVAESVPRSPEACPA